MLVSDARASDPTTDDYDVLVVGAGPSGAAAAYWLATRGHRVARRREEALSRARRPAATGSRRARCASSTTWVSPSGSRSFQRFDGLRSIAHGVTLELAWPEHPDFPPYGYVVRRRELDEMVAEQAVKAGATLWPGRRGGRAGRRRTACVTGAIVRDKDAGATETGPGPLRGRRRRRQLPVRPGARHRPRPHRIPLGMAIRGYFTSPFHDEPWIESHLDIRDRDGNHLPGYGWIFPVGDGTVNVGVGLLSTFPGWKHVNTTHLMEAFCETAPARWGISPETATVRADRRPPADRRVGDAAGRARPSSSSATPPGS